MKTHTLIGAEILAGHDSEILGLAGVIALTHHERWDGSGYPNGTKGEDIPVVGRITTVCDVFDALTSDRPYKSAWSVEDAVDFIRSGSGAQFDPNLVDLFIGILPEALAIREDYPDPLDAQGIKRNIAFASNEPRLLPWTWQPSTNIKTENFAADRKVATGDKPISELRNLDARR